MRFSSFILVGLAATLLLLATGCKQNDGHRDHDHSMRQSSVNAAM